MSIPAATALDAWPFDVFADVAPGVDPPFVVEGPVGATIRTGGREVLNFASIGFLGLQHRSEFHEHFARSAREHGLASGGSRMTQGLSGAHRDLESEISRVLGKDRALSFASGLLANIGFVHAVTGAMDLGGEAVVNNRDSVLLLDRDAHWSLWKAAEGLAHGRRVHAFRHNDPQDLDRRLSELARAKVVVGFESVYSADGSVAPVGELLDVCERHGAVSFIDDANGFLLYGPEHRPHAREYRQMRERADFVMVSLSKSVGLEGGAVAGPESAIRSFELLSGTSMFTAAVQPPTASTAAEIIRRLQRDPGVVDGYLQRVTALRARLAATRCPPAPSDSYIIPIPVNDDDKALRLRDRFLECGVLVPLFLYPAVPRNKGALRVILHAEHTDQQIEHFLGTLDELCVEIGI